MKWIFSSLLVLGTMALMWRNRVLIIRNQRAMIADNSETLESQI